MSTSELVADSCLTSFITYLPLVILPALEVALAWLYREGQCNDGIIEIMVHIPEEPSRKMAITTYRIRRAMRGAMTGGRHRRLAWL